MLNKLFAFLLRSVIYNGTAFSQSVDDFEIVQNKEGTVTIAGYTGILSQIDSLAVISIYGKELTFVSIPNGVIS
jgi:hypothetical protein